FVFQSLVQLARGDGNALGFLVATVNDSGNQVGVTTQAAARTFPQIVTRIRIQSEVDHHSLLAVRPGACDQHVGRLIKPGVIAGLFEPAPAPYRNMALMDSSLLIRRMASAMIGAISS